MASLIFNSALDDAMRGLIDFDTDTFKVMLVTGTYAPNKDTHLRRSDITNEVAGTGYTAGGNAATVTVTKDTANDRIDIGLGGAAWPTASITAAGAVYYKVVGGVAANEPIIAYIDFGGNIVATAGTFTLNASTLRLQN